MSNGSLKQLSSAAVSIGAMAAVVLTTLAVITGYKDTGKVDNTTAGYFVAGVAIFGTFISVVVLAIVGKVIYSMFNSK